MHFSGPHPPQHLLLGLMGAGICRSRRASPATQSIPSATRTQAGSSSVHVCFPSLGHPPSGRVPTQSGRRRGYGPCLLTSARHHARKLPASLRPQLSEAPTRPTEVLGGAHILPADGDGDTPGAQCDSLAGVHLGVRPWIRGRGCREMCGAGRRMGSPCGHTAQDPGGRVPEAWAARREEGPSGQGGYRGLGRKGASDRLLAPATTWQTFELCASGIRIVFCKVVASSVRGWVAPEGLGDLSVRVTGVARSSEAWPEGVLRALFTSSPLNS